MNVQETTYKAAEMHNAKHQYFVDMVKSNSNLKANAKSWTTSSASGSIAFVFLYLQLDCNLQFPGGPNLTFNGKGLVAGLGATGSLGGQASFDVDPNTLKGASGISFEAAGLGVGVGGFQVAWFKDGAYIGHGEFYGAGVALGTPGGGWGSFS